LKHRADPGDDDPGRQAHNSNTGGDEKTNHNKTENDEQDETPRSDDATAPAEQVRKTKPRNGTTPHHQRNK